METSYSNWSINCVINPCNENQLDAVPIVVYIYSIPPDDGLQICPKHVEVD